MSWFYKTIFRLGAYRRNPSIFGQFKNLKSSELLSRETLLQQNLSDLKEFVTFAYLNSQFYREFFDKSAFDPVHNWSLKAFQELPIVSKSDLVRFNEQIHTHVSKDEKTFFCETSGTSGQILTFHRDEVWDSFNRAAIWRGYSWFGVNPWDFRLYFWGYNSHWLKKLKLRFFDKMVNRYRVFDYDPKTMKKLESKLRRVKAIEGYSSMIYELANINQSGKLDFTNLKMVKGTSEKVFPHYQDIAKKVYGHRIINEYGSAESGIIAFECPMGSMHINLEGVYAEVDPATDGILVTNLKSRSFPIIRYALGDSVRFADPDFVCPCGMQHPVIEEVTGRIGKKILGENQNYPSLTLYYIFKNLYFNHDRKVDFQAHQFEKGRLQIWLKEPVSQEIEELIRGEAAKYYKDVELEILENHDFRQQKGKLRDFISHISQQN